MTDLIDSFPAGRTAAQSARVLASGRYAVLLTAAGGGFSAFDGFALTRWSADRTRDADAFAVYLRDADTGEVWSAGHQPVGRAADRYAADLDRAEIVRVDGDVETRTELRVAPEGDAELRRITLTNRGARARRVEVTTYAELVLNTPAGDAGHPAFSKLFVQTGWDAERRALVAWRRLRSPDDAPLWAVHRLLSEDDGEPTYETDRARFVGRGRTTASPAALRAGAHLSGTVGNVLDPVFALRRTVVLAPGASARLVAVLGAGSARRDVEAVADRYSSPAATDAVFAAAPSASPVDADALGIPEAWTRHVGDLPVPGDASSEDENRFRPASPSSEVGEDGLGWETEELRFFNGHGGFTADGREYVIRLPLTADGLKRPPLPWTNVIANEELGFLVSESGAGNTWGANSRENRLTPWFNDPVSDPHGEALYLRDEEAGTFWSPTPGPAPGAGAY
ncbi:MAG TPA: hypothetical protein VFQ39_19950, partial [Longimicrobium sp.]|nr:hypothetical protein [Longimicrobium sp.]